MMMAGGMLTPALSAQSVWQKMKQSVQQAERNAQAQQHRTQPASAKGSSPSAAASDGMASSGAASPAAPAAVDLSSPTMKALYRKLDIGGVQLGMTPQAAQAALQSRNRALVKYEVQPFAFTDLPNTEFTSRVNFKGPAARKDETESISLGLTLQPMQPEVLSIFRGTDYAIDYQPTAKNTVAALQAKYGPESLLEDSPSANEIFILWIFDGGGNLVSKARAEKIRSCGGNFREPSSGYIGRDALLPHWNTNCEPYTILKAILKTNFANALDSHGRSLPTGLLTGLQVVVTSNPLFTKTVTATRQMILAAKAANVQKNKKAADKNVPTL
ncbi:MAG: hypothetical protein J0G35_01945 [Acidobacteriales bacterium]|nr:hypothetical protein [Terriglobales bacterium]